MAKFSKPFLGCKSGEIYPTQFDVGDECPSELEEAAASVGALERQMKSRGAAPENKGK